MTQVKTKARVIVTLKCGRGCAMCVNDFEHARAQMQQLDRISPLLGLREIAITGGEPLRKPQRVIDLVQRVRHASSMASLPVPKIWMYSSIWTEDGADVLRYLDGLQYTIHDDPTDRDLEALAAVEGDLRSAHHLVSNRLTVEIGSSMRPLDIDSAVWHRVRLRRFMNETEMEALGPQGCVPDGEALYVWRGW